MTLKLRSIYGGTLKKSHRSTSKIRKSRRSKPRRSKPRRSKSRRSKPGGADSTKLMSPTRATKKYRSLLVN